MYYFDPSNDSKGKICISLQKNKCKSFFAMQFSYKNYYCYRASPQSNMDFLSRFLAKSDPLNQSESDPFFDLKLL